MKGILVLLWAACLVACSTLRKETATSVSTSSSQLNRQTELSAVQQWNILQTDSRGSQTEWRIWPKGIVSFSADSGFKGEAEKIEVRQNSNSHTASLATGKAEVNAGEQLSDQHQEKAITKKLERVSVISWYWWVALIVLMWVVIRRVAGN